MHEPLQNLPAMARILGVPKDWLKAEADAGRIPHLKVVDGYLFCAEAVERTLLARAASEPAGAVK